MGYSNGSRVGTEWHSGNLGVGPTWSGTLDGSVGLGNIQLGTSSYLRWSGSCLITSPADGVILFRNSAQTDFTRLQFGGTTNLFPALKRTAAFLTCVLADDSAQGGFRAAWLSATGVTPNAGAGEVIYGGSTATTVGAAGAAAALPATPTGYINVNVAGTAQKIPYYN